MAYKPALYHYSLVISVASIKHYGSYNRPDF